MIICHDFNGDLTLSNIRLLQAQKNRYDEFFTQIEDIDKGVYKRLFIKKIKSKMNN